MKDVGAKLLLSLMLLGTLAGCRETETSVSSLGRKLPAPSLKGTSPFDQDFESQNYARFQGTCDLRVGLIYVSFDNQKWAAVPATPTLTNTSLAANTQNDNDCSDGIFDFYITKVDLEDIWGISAGASITSDKVDYIYIKGATLIGDTETLTLIDSKTPGGGNSGGTTHTIRLNKSWPEGAAGLNQCGYLTASIVDSSGQSTSYSLPVTFNIKMSANGSSSFIRAYTSWSDCEQRVNDTDTFSIPKDQNSVQIVYRFPTSSAGDTLSFQVANNSALTAGPATAVILKDGSQNERWLATEGLNQIFKDICYPLTIRANSYDNASSSSSDVLDFTSSDNRVKFYSSSNCSSEITRVSFPSESDLEIYIKFTPSGSETLSFIPFEFTVSGASGVSNVYQYASATFKMTADITNKNLATKLGFWGPQEVINGHCNSIQIVSMNENNTQIPVNGKVSLSLASGSAGQFFSNNDCNTVLSTPNIAANSSSVTVYFKAAATPGTYTLTASGSGLTGTQSLTIKSVPTLFKLTTTSAPGNTTCTALVVQIWDGAGLLTAAQSTVTTHISFVDNTLTTFNNIYSSCDALRTPINSITFPTGTNQITVYIDTTGLENIVGNITLSNFAPIMGDNYSLVIGADPQSVGL